MVRFLLHNTLGAWWAGKVLAAKPNLASAASNEDALRTACALPGVSWDMLRFVKENDVWRPAAGTFPGWPTEARAITLLDPCCGSGHFLAEALPILAALRQVEERLSSQEAVAHVLQDNLFGLELDGRCVQIAAFAVALTAWAIGGWRSLPLPHIAWVGGPPPLPRAEFIALANADADLARRLGLLHELFVLAPMLGSLIDPFATAAGGLFSHTQAEGMERVFTQLVEKLKGAEPEREEGAIAARGMADATAISESALQSSVHKRPVSGAAQPGSKLLSYWREALSGGQRADLATAMLTRWESQCGGWHSRFSHAAELAVRWQLQTPTTHSTRRCPPQHRSRSWTSRAFDLMNWWAARTALVAITNTKPTASSCYMAMSADTGRDLSSKPALMTKKMC